MLMQMQMMMMMMMMMMMDRGKLLEASSPGFKVLPLLGRFQMHSTSTSTPQKPSANTHIRVAYLQVTLP